MPMATRPPTTWHASSMACSPPPPPPTPDPRRQAMRPPPQQRKQCDRDGYLFFPGLFSPEEIRTLTDAVPELYSRRDAYNVREKGSDAVRTNFAAHLVS